MSIASEITSIGENLKKDYQSIANLGADLTNVDKNIENIAELLDGVYDNLPKTSYQEGTEVNLGVTSKGKLDYDNGVVGIGHISQDSTQGYNLLNLKDYTETVNGVTITIRNGVITLNGTSTNYTTRAISQEATSQLNGDYNLNYEYVSGSVSGTTNINLYDGTTEVATLYANNTSKNQNISFSNQAVSTRLYYHNNAVFNNYTIKPMLYSGNYDSTKTFEPYTGGQASPNPSYPQTINSVTGNQDVVASGKNEINVPESIISARSYIYRANIGSGNYSISITKSRVEGVTIGNQYAYMYKEIKFYDSNDTLLSTNTGTSAPAITNSPVTKVFNFTAPQNTSYMEIEFSNNNGDNNLNTLLSNVMLVSGTYNESTMPTYEPYITPTSYQLSLGDIELCGIGNYKDELIYDVENDKVYKNEKIGKIQMTKDLPWGASTYEGAYQFFIREYNLDNFLLEKHQKYCNYFGYDGGNYKTAPVPSLTENDATYVESNFMLVFKTDGTQGETLNEWKTWLDNHIMWVLYRLATPTLTELTDETLHTQVKALYNAHSNNGTTIITSNGNLPMIIKVRGLKGE